MKKVHILASAFFMSVMLISCGDSEKSEKNSNEVTPEETAVESKNCNLNSFSFQLGEMGRTMNFIYDGDVLNSVNAITLGKNDTLSMTYTYNENGTLASLQNDNSIANYIYNEEEQLTEIKGEGSLNSRIFEYNEEGNISKQTTMFGNNPYTIHEYTYENGAPVKVSIVDKNGEVTEENVITYDDKPNPFAGKGIFANSTEMMYGYPVGNHTNNIVSIVKTYKKKSAWKVNGAYKMPGDTDTDTITYEYTEEGYPSARINTKGDREIRLEMTYDCK